MLDVSDLLMQMKDNFLRIVQRYKFCGKYFIVLFRCYGNKGAEVCRVADNRGTVLSSSSFLLFYQLAGSAASPFTNGAGRLIIT